MVKPTNEEWLNNYERRDMELAVESNTRQSGPLNKCKDLFKALQWLSYNGVFVHQFRSDGDKGLIQVEPTDIIPNPHELYGCKIVFKQ